MELKSIDVLGLNIRLRVPGFFFFLSCILYKMLVFKTKLKGFNSCHFTQKKATVCLCLGAGGMIDPYFLKNGTGENVAVNGDHHRAILIDYLISEIEARELGDI